MNISIRFRNLESSAPLRDYALRRIHFNLGRFGSNVARVELRLSDVNGPKGGRDCRCQITVSGSKIGTHTLDELREDAYAAVDIASERIGSVIGRSLGRVRASRRRVNHSQRRIGGPNEENRRVQSEISDKEIDSQW